MFNLLISADATAWESGRPMSMPAERFKEHSGNEAAEISAKEPNSLKALEEVPALLMYEWGTQGPSAHVVRYGFLEQIKRTGTILAFGFCCEAHCQRDLIDEFAPYLALGDRERNRTHWAIKDGDIPRDMLRRMVK
jgi:hypothetical protein